MTQAVLAVNLCKAKSPPKRGSSGTVWCWCCGVLPYRQASSFGLQRGCLATGLSCQRSSGSLSEKSAAPSSPDLGILPLPTLHLSILLSLFFSCLGLFRWFLPYAWTNAKNDILETGTSFVVSLSLCLTQPKLSSAQNEGLSPPFSRCHVSIRHHKKTTTNRCDVLALKGLPWLFWARHEMRKKIVANLRSYDSGNIRKVCGVPRWYESN